MEILAVADSSKEAIIDSANEENTQHIAENHGTQQASYLYGFRLHAATIRY